MSFQDTGDKTEICFELKKNRFLTILKSHPASSIGDFKTFVKKIEIFPKFGGQLLLEMRLQLEMLRS